MAIEGQKLVCRAPGAIAWCLMTMSASSLAKWLPPRSRPEANRAPAY
jgi:hypothetical protein